MAKREDPNYCAKGLHPWTEENVYVHPTTGERACRPCKLEANRNRPESTHPKGSGHCRRGHAYTEENTRVSRKRVNGQVVVKRSCKRCAQDTQRTTTFGGRSK